MCLCQNPVTVKMRGVGGNGTKEEEPVKDQHSIQLLGGSANIDEILASVMIPMIKQAFSAYVKICFLFLPGNA